MDAFELADFYAAIWDEFEFNQYPNMIGTLKPKNFRLTYEGQVYVIGVKGNEADACNTCLGYGTVERRDDSDITCPDCKGCLHLEPDFKDILTLEEEQANQTQRLLIQKRYGTIKPKSIADYWRKEA